MQKSRRSMIVTLCFFYIVLGLSPAAKAADCNQPKILSRIPFNFPFQESRPFVSVVINGAEEFFLVDTATNATSINSSLINRLKLPNSHAESGQELYDASGRTVRDVATAKDFTIGTIHNTNKLLPTTAGYSTISRDILANYDVDLDFSAKIMTFYSQDHCSETSRGSFAKSVVPITISRGVMTVPVTLDGHQFSAAIDTRSTLSTLRAYIAQHSYGLTLGSREAPEKSVKANAPKTYSHVFNGLSIGELAVGNAAITLIPDAAPADSSGSVIPRGALARLASDHPDLVIGMDILSRLHLYLAFGEGRLYVSALDVAPSPPMLSFSPRTEASAQLDVLATKPDLSGNDLHWKLDTVSKCWVFNRFPMPDETVAWVGQCTDGIASGSGTLTWYREGKFDESYSGVFVLGSLNGHATAKRSDGNTIEGEWQYGIRGPGAVIYTRANGNRCEAQAVQIAAGIQENGQCADNFLQ